ncbi:MAG: hypothetical protein ACFWUJ_17425 [Pseudomonas fragi]
MLWQEGVLVLLNQLSGLINSRMTNLFRDFGREADIIDLAGRSNLDQATPGVLFPVLTNG